MNQQREEKAFMEAGVKAHNVGDLENAEENYRNALAINPHNPDGLHLLGYLAYQLGHTAQAISLIEDAIQIMPDNPLFYNNLASVFLSSGDKDGAIRVYRKSITLNKNDPDILNDLGNLFREKAISQAEGESLKEAEKYIRKAIEINPKRGEYHNNLGNVLRDFGPQYFDESRKSYERALELDPNLVGVIGNFGLLAQMEGDLDQSEKYLKQAVEQAPENFEVNNNYALILTKRKRIEEAIPYFEIAETLAPDNYLISLNKVGALMHIRRDEDALATLHGLMELDPSRAEAYWNFAITLRKMGKLKDAEHFARTALEHFPNNINLRHELASQQVTRGNLTEAEQILREIVDEVGDGKVLMGGAGIYATLGVIYLDSGTPEQILGMFELAMEVDPDNKDAHNNYALCLLSLGMLEEGWKLYKTRWESDEFTSPVRPFQKPMWEGQPLEGKTIALWGEQGIGDELRFASLIPEMMNKGANIIIECDPRLVDLFARSFEGAKIYGRAEDLSVPYEDQCDYQLPIVDLAGFFRPTLASFPQHRYAFLKADPGRLEFWRKRLTELGPRPKVGVLWRSMLVGDERMPHYVTVQELEPILTVQGVDFINLMYAECSEDRARIADLYGAEIRTWDDINLKDDQDDLAALIANLDLVVCPWTAPGSLATALDIPAYYYCTTVRAPELLGDPDAPGWAPSAKYFIKGYEKPWGPVMDDIAVEIKRMFNLP